jgi:hypothetical protein
MDFDYTPTNRERKLAPKPGEFWCWNCDRHVVAIGQRCKACGAKPARKTLKKDQGS